jgi:hypothetical protein
MQTHYVRILCDIHCKFDERGTRYRIFVNDELFTERTWIWTDRYLEESLQIDARPGLYPIRFELVEPDVGKLKVKNLRVDHGPAVLHKDNILEILK